MASVSCKSIWESDSESQIVDKSQSPGREKQIKTTNKKRPNREESTVIIRAPKSGLCNDATCLSTPMPTTLTKIKQACEKFPRVTVCFSENSTEEQDITLKSIVPSQLKNLEMKIKSILIESSKGGHATSSFRNLTHFLCIPFTHKCIEAKLHHFKEIVLENYGGPERGCNIDESLFQNPRKIHMTFDVLIPLNDSQMKEKACHTLDACGAIAKEIICENVPLKVDVKGLGYFGSSPEKARVLFAQLEDKDGLLQKLANAFVDKFESEGLIEKKRERDSVKCHITLLNKTFRDRAARREEKRQSDRKLPAKRREGEAKVERGKKNTEKPGGFFNITTLMQELQGYEFARDVPIECIHLSTFAKTDDATGFYSSLRRLQLV